MAITPQAGIKAQYETGDTITWTEHFTSYPPADWTATVYFNLNGTPALNSVAAESDGDYVFNITAEQSAALTPGTYAWAIYVVNSDSQRETARTGILTLIPNLATQHAKSMAEQQLDALNETILTLSAGGDAAVSFNGQSVTKRDLTQLMRLRPDLEAQVFREKRLAANLRGQFDSGNILSVFGPTSYGPYPNTYPFNQY